MRYLAALILLTALCETAPSEASVVVYLAGDSTMAGKRWRQRPETGWGECLQPFFDKDAVRIENHAVDGASTRSFIADGRWQALAGKLRRSDFVFIQFGHNDEPAQKTQHTSPAEFRGNLLFFIEEVRRRNATPVLLTPIVRRRFDAAGVFVDSHGSYPDIVRSVAAQQAAPLMDLHRKSATLVQQLGEQASRKMFLHLRPYRHFNYLRGVEDNTHLAPKGAALIAELAAEEIRRLALDLPLADAAP